MSLGVLSIHLEGEPCAVGCPFCYLAARHDGGRHLPVLKDVRSDDELVRAVETFDYAELAVAVSEPIEDAVRFRLKRLLDAAATRGKDRAVTTTHTVVSQHPSVLDGATRLNLSVDAWKMSGPVIEEVIRAAEIARARGLQVIAMATLSTPAFAEALIGTGRNGLLERLVDLPVLDGVALSALKPPPPFCDRAFWLDALARLAPLLDRALDRRLFLDCYVAARLLQIGGCPARPDLTPSATGLQFRSCVYSAAPDVTVGRADELRLDDFTAPAVCPFDTRF